MGNGAHLEIFVVHIDLSDADVLTVLISERLQDGLHRPAWSAPRRGVFDQKLEGGNM